MIHKLSLRALRISALVFLQCCLSSIALAAGYQTITGKIYDGAGSEVQIRGVSHFGFNGTSLAPQFLWSMGWKEQIAQIKSLGFNAVRVPFVPDTLYNTTPIDKLGYIDPNKNPEFVGKTALQALDLWMAEADRQGLYIMLDFHSVSMQRQYPTWFVSDPADFNLVYNNQAYTPDDWIRDLKFVAQRYGSLRYFFAIDVNNEPNGKVRWSSGDASMTDPKYFWKEAVESAAAAILAVNPNLLIFVQGTIGNYDGIENSETPMNWAENFQPEAYKPLNIPISKLVLSPHTYGPDVYMKATFSLAGYPSNLAAGWEMLFGQFSQTYAVVPGEWGGRYGFGGVGWLDVQWQEAFVDYLLKKGMSNSFYWCYTPNSFDTGGVLDDQLNVREDKMKLLHRLWGTSPPASTPPNPTSPTPTPAPSAPPDASPSPPAQSTPAPPDPASNTPITTSPPTATTAAASDSLSRYSASGGGGAVDVWLIGILCIAMLWRVRSTMSARRYAKASEKVRKPRDCI